jgi:hypothetical protein
MRQFLSVEKLDTTILYILELAPSMSVIHPWTPISMTSSTTVLPTLVNKTIPEQAIQLGFWQK